jgi:multidrug efflux pump subunit AcrB
MNPIRGSLKTPQVTLAILLIVFAAGIWALLHMPRREDPKVEANSALVIAMYPGAKAEEVEAQVTNKLEQRLFQFAEVRKAKTHSTTRDGLAVIQVELENSVKDADAFWGKLRNELLVVKSMDLPKEVLGPIVNSDFGDTKAIVIAVESDEAQYDDIKTQVLAIEAGLRQLPEISKFTRIGEQDQEIQVTARSDHMAQYGITLEQVLKVIQSQNSIVPTGTIESGKANIHLFAEGKYRSLDDLRDQILGTSPTGSPVRLGQVADLERRWKQPTSHIKVNGRTAMLLALEMQEGYNIVEFGKQVDAKLAQIRENIPSRFQVHKIIDQPHIVEHAIDHFMFEFLLAIVSVIIVTVVLLPLRVATVAAMAIPMTVAATFALLHFVGMDLNQVSLAALVVALGMVVDDAIVIADNYVELMDHGVPRSEAAWRSASDLLIPVLAATATIIAAFMPLLILKGMVGKFIFALPVTVSISLSASFMVALFFTPLLCKAFIAKGIHSEAKPGKRKFSPLDGMQRAYDALIRFCVARPAATLALAFSSIAVALLLKHLVPERFFVPAADRNQFVIEVWTPTGSPLKKTEEMLANIEARIKGDARIKEFATFSGTSAPRFYYAFAPEFPTSEFGQIVVNTRTNEDALTLSKELDATLPEVAAGGQVHVRLMQQGPQALGPVEVRITGPDLAELQRIGTRVDSILRATPGSAHVKSDFHEDVLGMGIHLNEWASRLGFTNGSVSQTVYTGFSGYQVSTLWEGDTPVEINLRMEEAFRNSSERLENTYLRSPATNAVAPLRQIADIRPEWTVGRIRHRNGERTLTISCDAVRGGFPSRILEAIKPKLAAMPLPRGYAIRYGGEDEDSRETFGQMVVALSISLLAIFLVLLIQFRSLREVAIVLSSIPLSLMGAFLGLYLTGYDFGMTAFVGLISLTGIVVRNAIILVDYAKELIGKGMDVRTAALEAGRRRLRPIFLTAMAAAIGVVPMILSGSSLWGPLASVIAFGVVFSMVMTLVVVPILMILWVPQPQVRNERAVS